MAQNQNASEGAKRITFLLGRLTVLRSILRTQPVSRLFDLCDAVASGDATRAAGRYHAMTAALLEQNIRRVTGDIWKDFIFSEMLESYNRFSVLAAERHMDPPVLVAMRQDMRLMQELFDLTGSKFIEWIGSMNPAPAPKREAGRGKSDDGIIRMAASAWSGGSFIRERPKPQPVDPPAEIPALPKELELDRWVSWNYDDPGERVEYVADEGLAVIYRRFLAEKDWGNLAEPLMEFHAQYGCGEFLRYRVFLATDEGLQGIDPRGGPLWDDLTGIGPQKEKLYANTLRFLHTGKGEHVLLYGPDGMGKTSLMLALARELEDLRVILLAQRDFSSSMETLRSLASQPFRFIAVMDDLALSEREYRRLKAALACQPMLKNALIYATAPVPPSDSSVFGLEIAFAMPTYQEFCTMVSDVIRRERAPVSDGEIQSACARWQEEKADFSVRSARRLAWQLIRKGTD